MKNLTMSDIAKRAGVSRSAVSFCLNGKAKLHRLSDEVVQRIQSVIEESRYTPNLHARAIGLKKTFLVGVVSPNPKFNSFWNEIFAGIETTLRLSDYHMILGVSEDSFAKEREIFEFMLRKGVDGIICQPAIAADGSVSSQLRDTAERIPVVSILASVAGFPCVRTDDELGGRLAAQHLVDMGHSKIAYLGLLSETKTHPLNARFNGAKDVLSGLGLALPAFPSVQEFMENVDEFSAVFCYSDFIAGDLYKACMANGVRIPDDISVVGFDNMGFTRFFHPALTTIHQAKEEIGVEAAKLVLSEISKTRRDEPEFVKLMPSLKLGASVLDLSGRKRA